jgi:hypothetical protein
MKKTQLLISLFLVYSLITNHQSLTAQNVGVNTNTPLSILSVKGNAAIGASYGGTIAAPTNGLIVQGKVGIGTSAPSTALHIASGNLLNTGTFGSATTFEISSAGTRLFFNPRKALFRAGYVDGTQWNSANLGNYSTATGYNVRATNSYSTALGYAAYASGQYATALGYTSTASNSYATALGNTNTASGESSTAFGPSSTASGKASATFNFGSTASGEAATAFGNTTTASGKAALAAGERTTAPSFSETVLGRYNTTYTPLSTTTWNSADRLFVIGNGTASGATSNALMILKNGNIGIGNSTPSVKLAISGTTKTTNLKMTNGATNGYLLKTDASGNTTWTDPTTLTFGTSILTKLQDADGNTKAETEKTNNEDKIRFSIAGNERWVMNRGTLEVNNTGNAIYIGNAAGNADTYANNSNNIGIGTNTLRVATAPANQNNTAIGYYAVGSTTTGTDNVGIGLYALYFGKGSYNTAIGNYAGFGGSGSHSGSYNTFGGAWAGVGLFNAGSNNTTVGYAADCTTNSGAVLIGYQVGSETSNVLQIDNSFTSTPLIWGDFSNNYANINGNLGIGTTTPTERVEVVGKTKTTNFQMTNGASGGALLTADASGNATWATPIWSRTGADPRFNFTGNLGIGTTSPSEKLDVSGKIKTTTFQLTTSPTSGYILKSDASGNATWVDKSSLNVGGWTTSGSDIYAANSGNIGIGTTAPSSKLDIQSSSSVMASVQSSGSSTNLNVVVPSGQEAGFQMATYSSGSASARWVMGKSTASETGSDAGGNFFINRYSDAAAYLSQPFQIKRADGYVGLGITPTYPAHFYSTDNQLFMLESNSTTGTWLMLKNNSTNGRTWDFFSAGSGNSEGVGAFCIKDETSGSVRMTITSTGLVGIGTSNPTKGFLEVNGSKVYPTNDKRFAYFAKNVTNANISWTTGSEDFSIYSSERFGASEFNAFSDRRIKNPLGQSNAIKDLDILRGVKITDYKMVDSIAKGNKVIKKVIAQELAEVLPNAVNISTNVVPNIYKVATMENGFVSLDNHGLAVGDKVQLIFGSQKELCKVLAINEKGFEIEFQDNSKLKTQPSKLKNTEGGKNHESRITNHESPTQRRFCLWKRS